jgi:hypothetical protein
MWQKISLVLVKLNKIKLEQQINKKDFKYFFGDNGVIDNYL